METSDAVHKVRAILARELGDSYNADSLDLDVSELPGGWLILPRTAGEDSPRRGAPVFTVDRQDGGVRRFASAFPPVRIVEMHDELKTQYPALNDG
ncbi:hypothetical protein Airi02_046240 [Actinoallomurus iriomotensis]|uniref:Immunity protein 35 domain-containing protein n=1 Tax=Actinoallomurus iriomotensis TaxID=478107 RepID=A0A9W6S758_9ACTN|nr:hypothetical protein Airi02_046240 [Actinoallomurus iriomotensis]